ncbi:Glutamate receptor 2.7 [Forsythia ovata]|uniref:Glutamate receptor n=1 Tax=Forsythia ovata TaxID=205694 RepID=A0ABD1Q915_9LAMI
MASLFPLQVTTASPRPNEYFTKSRQGINYVDGILGAIVDCTSRVGKEERVAMEMAIEDLYKKKNQRFILHLKCSHNEPLHAATAARNLIKRKHVQAILGPRTWEELSAVNDVSKQSNVPILSFADSGSWATENWPFLMQASPRTYKQMKAVAAMIQSWGWRRVNVIYEDSGSFANEIIPHLYEALQEGDAKISNLVPLPSFANSSLLHEELRKLKREQCRVFVLHTSLSLAARVFEKAKEMKMMDKDYVWITTDSTTSLVHSVNPSLISSMQGVLGVRSYFTDTGQDFSDFDTIFQDKFSRKYPVEKNHEPGIFALQAYDAIWIVGLAMQEGNMKSNQILEKIAAVEFNGLSGKIQFKERKLAPANQFQIINIIGKSYRELGFWSDGLGFSKLINTAPRYNFSMQILGGIFWPGATSTVPRGWDFPIISNPLRIGVPNGSLTDFFVKVEYHSSTSNYSFSGFSLRVFEETVSSLKYFLPYQFIPYEGNYTDLVMQVQLKQFDAAVGDIAIISRRYEYVEFTHSHTEAGLVMVVPIQSDSTRTWLFIKPFTVTMWLLAAFINIYNGFVVWTIERHYRSELGGPILNQIGTLLWLAFSTLFSSNGEKLHSNLSRIATIVWLFVAIILTQSYTASLTSMLTVQRLQPNIENIEMLKSTNAFIGYSQRSFVKGYLEEALGFHSNYLRKFSSTQECAEALRNGKIAVAFFEAPVAKVFVAQHCKTFTIAGPRYHVGGYGFAFPKGSPLLPDIDTALLNVLETGVVKNLEDDLIASQKCIDIDSDNESIRLSPQSFFGLFIITGSTSTVALGIYYFCSKSETENSMPEPKGIWMLIIMVLKILRYQRKRIVRKVSDAESPRNSANTSHSRPQV